MAYQHYRTRAIFLAKEDRVEADQIFFVYTADLGKLEITGKAIRKIDSKLRSGAGLFYYSEIEFVQGKNQKTLTDAVLIDKFQNVLNEPAKLSIAAQICQIAHSLLGFEQPDEKVWVLLLFSLQGLGNLPLTAYSLQLTYYYFFWNLLTLSGYSPQLRFCAVCNKKLMPETFFFSPGEGGVVCWQCFGKIRKAREQCLKEQGINGLKAKDILAKEALEITVGAVKILRLILDARFNPIKQVMGEAKDFENLRQITELQKEFS
ncbi:MAG: DNA repair protein RecO [Patescibacteria group bacterium]|nr:DNA repair protein RecO [Patescibacteria group bacterium]